MDSIKSINSIRIYLIIIFSFSRTYSHILKIQMDVRTYNTIGTYLRRISYAKSGTLFHITHRQSGIYIEYNEIYQFSIQNYPFSK